MDDLLVSCENEQELMGIKDGLSSVLQRGGFTLTKWVNNARPQEEVAKEDTELRQVTILRIQWNVEVDNLQLCRGLVQKRKDIWTQRAILSVVLSVYDPLGCFAPFTVVARLILKEIWTSHDQRWDDPVCEDFSERFNNWISQLDEINTVNNSRPYETTLKDITHRQLHIFADASESAFSAAYFRSTYESGVESSFIMGKSRVAPQKFLTNPRLELVAAVSAVMLKLLIVEEHDYVIGSIYFWTDSMTDLLWIRSYAQNHQVFVANRVSEIMDSSTVDQWNHVPGDRNPADIGTGGVTITLLRESDWLTGPAWLLETNEWPIQPETLSRTEETFATISDEIKVSHFSSYMRLRNVVTRVLSWKFKKSKKNS